MVVPFLRPVGSKPAELERPLDIHLKILVDKEVDNTIHIIKDSELLDVNTLIAKEKLEGRARHVIYIPKWMALCGYYCIKVLFGKSNKTYLVFKALWPFRTCDE